MSRSFDPPIEISSSPEPEDFPPPRRKPPSSRAKPAPSRPRQVIVLTDSDSDSPASIPRQQIRGIPRSAGSSSTGSKPSITPAASQSGSPQTKGQRASGSNVNPLFFPASDEENNPLFGNGQSASNPHSPRRTAGTLPLRTASAANAAPHNVYDLNDVFFLGGEADWTIGWNNAAVASNSNAPVDALEQTIQQAPENSLLQTAGGTDPIPPQPEPEPEPFDPNPENTYLASVLEILPDVDPDHALSLVLKHMPESQQATVERVLHVLFENPSYPKAQKNKGKKRQVDGEEDEENAEGTPSKKVKIDYSDKQRPYKGGPDYNELALEYLQVDFPFAPKPFLRSALTRHNSLYAPTYLYLRQAEIDFREGRSFLPYQRKSIPYSQGSKGKSRQLQDAEFEAERAWIAAEYINPQSIPPPQEEEEVDPENGIECGCCFSSFSFDKMVQCPEAHLFCSECMTSYASTLLGSHNPDIKCMDQSGCKAEIPPSELKRFLPKKLLKLWERVKQRKEVQAAGLEDLEECPFCEWGCVIENPDEKLLRCGNEDECGIVSCRSCKKKDHLPKSCKEAEEDKHLDSQHLVEEAMTQALMRNCPKCKNPFIKEYGCNKMTCPNCQCLSCYVCRQEIKSYDHFNQTPSGQPSSSRNSGKCPLYDSVESRHAEEVKEAAKAALEQFKKDNPNAEEGAIKVDIPTAPIPANGGGQAIGVPAHDPLGYAVLLNRYMAARQRADAERNAAEQALFQVNRELHQVQLEVAQVDREMNVLHQTRLRRPDMELYYRQQIIQAGERRGLINTRYYAVRLQATQATERLAEANRQLAVIPQQFAAPPPVAAVPYQWNGNRGGARGRGRGR